MLWIPITLAAATFQILRTSRQHELRTALTPGAAGFVRYLYGAPFAWALAAAWFLALPHDVPEIPGRFWPLVTAAGVAQIIATVALLRAFRARDFAVGTIEVSSTLRMPFSRIARRTFSGRRRMPGAARYFSAS